MFPSPPSLTKTERCASKTRIRRWEYWAPGSARRRLDFDASLTVVTSSQSSPDLVPALELPRAMGSMSSPEQIRFSGEQEEEENEIQDLGDAVDTQKEVVEGNGSKDGDDFDFDSPEVTSSKSSLCVTPTPTSEGDLLGTILCVEMAPTMVVMQQEEEPESVISEAEEDAEDKTGSDEDNYLDGDDTEDSGDDQDDLDSEAPNVVHHLEERYGLRPRRNNEWFGMSDEDRNANQELVNGILEESNRDEKVSGAAHSLLQRVSETFLTTVFKDAWEIVKNRSDDTVRRGHVTTAAKLRGKRKRRKLGSEVEQLDQKKH